MNDFTNAAGVAYFRLSIDSYYNWLIGEETFLERIQTLRSLLRPDSELLLMTAEVFGESQFDEDWPPRGDDLQRSDFDEESGTSASANNDRPMEFICKHGELNKWRFKIGDIDNFPSIPHAHNRENDSIKLDAYHGYTYQKMRQLKRLKRKTIVDLWNDEDFRLFASAHIDYYLQVKPRHLWRVSNPRRLPKRR